jgi:hypothetical protein
MQIVSFNFLGEVFSFPGIFSMVLPCGTGISTLRWWGRCRWGLALLRGMAAQEGLFKLTLLLVSDFTIYSMVPYQYDRPDGPLELPFYSLQSSTIHFKTTFGPKMALAIARAI